MNLWPGRQSPDLRTSHHVNRYRLAFRRVFLRFRHGSVGRRGMRRALKHETPLGCVADRDYLANKVSNSHKQGRQMMRQRSCAHTVWDVGGRGGRFLVGGMMFATGLVMAAISVRDRSPVPALVGLGGMGITACLIDRLFIRSSIEHESLILPARWRALARLFVAVVGFVNVVIGLGSRHWLIALLGGCFLITAVFSNNHHPDPSVGARPARPLGAVEPTPIPPSENGQ